ncbi:MAG: hypothetical protein JNG88_06855 [Phycisphaerales bacterium]|nr:hypothetical protein [Phycisphaerales bacterium]
MSIMRSIIAVVVSYFVIAVVGMALFFTLVAVLPKDQLLQPGTFRATAIVNTAAIFIGLLAAAGGGMVCTRIGGPRPAMALAAIVFALGAAMGVQNQMKPDPGMRPDDMSLMDAIAKAKEPTWIAVINPILGVAGVMLGSWLARAKPPEK